MSRKALAAGVGNNPDTISRVRSANAGSEDTMPFRIVPERCEAMEDDVQTASAEGGHIFNDDPFGLKLADEAEIHKPQARRGPREGGPEPLAASTPSKTTFLAGTTPGDDVDGDADGIQNL